ncbi:MAG: hypothetical protein ACI8X5_004271, partial [Planctomycetota bacterium]
GRLYEKRIDDAVRMKQALYLVLIGLLSASLPGCSGSSGGSEALSGQAPALTILATGDSLVEGKRPE